MTEELSGIYHHFSLRYDGEVAIITLDNADRKNALDFTTKRELTEVFFHLNLDSRTRAILITGANGDFCAGDDIRRDPNRQTLDEQRLTVDVPRYHREPAHTYRAVRSVTHTFMRTVLESDVPTVAAIDGYAVQSGLSLALCCDLRVASQTARLSSGTLRYAMLPDEGGHYLLVRAMGLARATRFVLLSEFVAPVEALATGLVQEVVEGNSAYDRGLEIAKKISMQPATATRLAKRAMRRAAESSVDDALDFVALAAAVSDYDADMDIGRAIFAKRDHDSFRRYGRSEQG